MHPPLEALCVAGRVRMTLVNKYIYTIFIDIDIICSEWGARNIFSSHEGALQK